MSLWTLLKLIAALCVAAVMVLTGMLAYHVAVRPLGGIFAKIIPDPVQVSANQTDTDFAKMLDSSDMPDIDPGEKAFQKAHELLAMGKNAEAREKLISIINIFPGSSTAPIARRIVGEMNLDEILSSSNMTGKQTYVVKSGDSFLAIAAKNKTTIESIMHLNSMMEFKKIQPGDEFVIMPLEFRLLIEPQRKSLSLWEAGRFIREFPILNIGAGAPLTAQHTTINSKSAESDGKRVQPQSKNYASAEKILQLTKPPTQIRSWDGSSDKPSGILLRPQDMEELSLLTRVGNDVEIR
ncbi:MAG: LysM peptidoglycan-binding domain-containing protein [Gloeobacteraceae cyanobacterium ES-bin-144]|nr:LysM peptidoglycan-binding domain-containing protein [Verrucomicrobiales bacterium]